MSKHNKLSFLFFSLIILASASICSCKNLIHGDFIEEREEKEVEIKKPSGASYTKYIKISGEVEAAAAGAVPSDYYSTNQNQGDNRSAFPTNPSTIYYEVIAEDLNGTYSNVSGTISGSSYTINLQESKWKLTAKGYSDVAKTNLVVQAVCASLDLTKAETSTTVNLNAIPVQDANVKGKVKLAVSVEDASKISYAEINWKEGATTKVQKLNFSNDAKTQNFTMDSATPAAASPVEVTPGSYEVVFNYYDNSTSKKLLYSFTQIVNVYSNLLTDAWVGKAAYISADGSITITNTMATYGTKTEFYVGTSGNDTTGTGGFFSPFKSIYKAIEIIKSINDTATVYKVKLLSDLTAINGDIFTDVTYGRCFVYITSDSTLNIDISSYNGPYKIDANGTTTNARVIFVGSNVNLTLENITVTGGKPVKANGAGIYVCSGAKLVLNNGAVVEQNGIDTEGDTTKYYGNGIYAKGSLELNNGVKVTYNVSIHPDSDVITGGGMFFEPEATGDLFVMNGGIVSYNKAAHGGGFCAYGSNSAEINGGEFSNNWSLNTGGGIWTSNRTNSSGFVIKNCTFQENESRNGGGIFVKGNLVITDCKFIKNKSQIRSSKGGNGAGVGIWQGNVIVSGSNTLFSENEAESNGGAIYCSSGNSYGDSSITISAGKFSGNTAGNSGSGIYVSDYKVDTTNYFIAKLNLSGSVLMNADQIIYLDYLAGSTDAEQKYINLGALTGSAATQKFTLDLGQYTGNPEVLKEAVSGGSAVSSYYDRFTLVDSNYEIKSDGKVKSKTPVIAGDAMSGLYTDKTAVATIPESGKTYLVSSEDDLIYLGTLVNAGNDCSGVTFKLSQSLVLTGTWTPIGTGTTKFFSGTFDGCGFEISQINCSNSTIDYQGFFSSVKDGAVSNLKVSGVITGKSKCAGIVAYTKGNVSITNCISNVNVTGTGYIAGIVGYSSKVNNGDTCSIKNCINNGDLISSGDHAGGIFAGNAASVNISIQNCGNTGSVTANSSVGGIAGTFQSHSGSGHIIDNSWNSGTLTGTASTPVIGSVIGTINSGAKVTTKKCYYVGTDNIVGSDSSSGNSTTTNCSKFTKSGSVCTLDGTTDNLVDVLNSWITSASEGNDPTYSSYKQWYRGISGYPDFVAAPDPLPVAAPTSGTYTAVSDADFTTIAGWVNSSEDGLANVTIKLYDDLTINNWTTPIGSSTKPFTGTFDGNGKTLTIENLTGSDDVGLFGYVENAVIKNLNVIGTPSGSSTGNVAGIVGHSKGNITIDNCTMNGYIGCSNATNVGGIIAYAETNNAAEKVIIKNCLNKNGIVGKDNVGGIIGCMSGHGSILIENCGSLISVQGQSSSYVGGIIGMSNCSSTTLTNCFTQAVVTPTPSGTATSGLFVGAFVNTDDSGTMVKCYGNKNDGIFYGGTNEFAGFNNDDNPNYEILQISGTSKSKCFISNVTPQKDLVDALNDWCNENGSGYTLWKYTDDNGAIGFDN